eukprot:588840-Rhodomonas_salina.1
MRQASTWAPLRPSPAPTGPWSESELETATNGQCREEGWHAPGAQYTRASLHWQLLATQAGTLLCVELAAARAREASIVGCACSQEDSTGNGQGKLACSGSCWES